MKKYKLIILALFFLFVGCASTSQSVVVQKSQQRKPLDPDAVVSFLLASQIPLVPENAEYVTTMETGALKGEGCTEEETVSYLEKTARELGANFVFVKKMGTYQSYVNECNWFLVDMYYLHKEAEK